VIDDLTPQTRAIDRGNLSLLLVKTFFTFGDYSLTENHLCTPIRKIASHFDGILNMG